MDYSFLKLYNSIDDALNDNRFKDVGISYYTNIQLFNDEPYLQTTNYEGGISFSSDFDAYVVDDCGNTLKDITDYVFMEEFVDEQGQTQVKIEILGLNINYYGRAVFIKITANVTTDSYYTRPIKITNKQANKTYRIDYKNNTNLEGLSYVNADCYQSIRLSMKFTGYSNSSEVGEYYQISTGNNISTRFLKNIGESFLVENIDTYTFIRLQELFLHDVIYIDGRRVTNKPVLEQSDRIGHSNLFKATFTAFFNDNDTYAYDYQVFDGVELISVSPEGDGVLCDFQNTIKATFNYPISIETGSLDIYDSSTGILIYSYDASELYVLDENTLAGDNLSFHINEEASYYVLMDSSLVEVLGIPFEGIANSDAWVFALTDGEYEQDEYNNDEYLTGCDATSNIFNSRFNTKFN
jgi:hypothetical protein